MNKPAYELPSDLGADIDAYESEVGRFLSGKMPAAILKAKRVPRGVYEQRKDGTYMIRVRVAAGILTNNQVRLLSDLSSSFGDGILHITTRQDVQLHGIGILDTPKIMRRLMDVGLTSRGGGGNTVRNVTACPYAGVCPQECMDVTTYACAVTEYLIKLTGSYNLPRKYKISLSGCRADCGLAQIADLGFVAELRNGHPGFRVFAGGGMGTGSRIGSLLLEWTPAQEVIRIAESIRRLFDRHGDRKNKNRARLRFVVEKLGEEEFRRVFDEELHCVIQDGVPQCNPRVSAFPDHDGQRFRGPVLKANDGIRYLEQHQTGLVTVPIHARLGLISSESFVGLAELASRFSAEGGLRTTRTQGVQLRFVRREDLSALADELQNLSADSLSATEQHFVSCAGADTCRLGLCLSRGAVLACEDRLRNIELTGKMLDGFSVFVNGCPNACGHQPIAPIGLSGSAQRVNGHLIPFYKVTMGGRCDSRGARFGLPVGQIPAKSLTDFIGDLANDFSQHHSQDEAFLDYFERMGHAHFTSVLSHYTAVPRFEDRPEFYRDFGSDELFSLAGRGAGECGSGVFEVIQEDLTAAGKATEPFEILLPACRALLITRGIDSREPDTIFRKFEEHFVNTGLVSEEFRPLLSRARSYLQGWKEAFQLAGDDAVRLLERVKLLYSTLDGNLEFHPPDREISVSEKTLSVQSEPASPELDLRGVACPMNFVKAKLKLETISVGESLTIVLDDGAPIQNVPASFRSEGQEVVGVNETGDGHWKVTVRKTK